MSVAEPVTLDFSGTFAEIARKNVVAFSEVEEKASNRKLAQHIPDHVIEAARATYVATGGAVSETARYHDLNPDTVQRLAYELEWPVYGNQSAEKSHRQHQHKIFVKLEEQMLSLARSLEVEFKDPEHDAQVSKRQLSQYLEPLSSRHSAFKTVFDAWMRLGTMLYPEDFARDPDPANYRAQEAREQVRDLALLGAADGIRRNMEELINKAFVASVPDQRRGTEVSEGGAEVIDAEVVDEHDD